MGDGFLRLLEAGIFVIVAAANSPAAPQQPVVEKSAVVQPVVVPGQQNVAVAVPVAISAVVAADVQ